MDNPIDLPVRVDRLVVVVVETPSGSGNKYKLDLDLGSYRLDRTLPPGMVFPFEFGFVPQTVADDGDPLDAIVLVDTPLFPGCVVRGRLIGILEMEQQDGGTGPWKRNDRLILVPGDAKGHASSARSVRDIDPYRLAAMGAFFPNYHALDGDKVRIVGRAGVAAAEEAIRKAHAAYREHGVGDRKSA